MVQVALSQEFILNGICMDRLRSTEVGPFLQFVKYGISGGMATGVHIVIFHLCAWLLFPALQESDLMVTLFGLTVLPLDDATRATNSMYSNAVAFICSNMVAYVLNILFVFESGRHNRIVEIAMFYLVSGISVVIGTALMGFLIRHYHMQTTIAFSANIVSAVMINYAVRKYFIFKG
jgi:putative flippase GtrA